MMPHDDAFLDSVAVLALGALPEAEAREVAAHLATCASCRELYAELRPAADLIGYVAEAPVARDELGAARMKARVMNVARADVGALAASGRDGRANSKRSSGAWFGAVAAVVVAALIGADDLSFRARAERTSAEQRANIAALTTRKPAADPRLLALLAPGSKHFGIPQGEIVTRDGRLFIAMRLPAAPSGKVYQAWTLAKGAKAVAPSVTFTPGANGLTIVELPVDAQRLAAVAVSVEPAGGSKAPTSTPKFIRKLS